MEQAGTTWNELKPPGHHVEQIETTWNNKKKNKKFISGFWTRLCFIYTLNRKSTISSKESTALVRLLRQHSKFFVESY